MNSDERRSARANVILTGTIEHSNSRLPVRIRDVSEHGAQVIGDMLPAPDTRITLRCNGKAVDGWVAWSQGERAGIEFGEPTPPDDLTKRARHPNFGITKDTREIEFRRPGFRGNQLSEEERRIIEEWTKPSRE
jgi:hypothetical protein